MPHATPSARHVPTRQPAHHASPKTIEPSSTVNVSAIVDFTSSSTPITPLSAKCAVPNVKSAPTPSHVLIVMETATEFSDMTKSDIKPVSADLDSPHSATEVVFKMDVLLTPSVLSVMSHVESLSVSSVSPPPTES